MAKPIKWLLSLVILLVLLAVGYRALTETSANTAEALPLLLMDRVRTDIVSIRVSNQNGGYTFRQEGGGYMLHDLPPSKVNEEYVAMLLDESSRIECLSEVTGDLNRLADYGLTTPVAQVDITYTDGAFSLLLGAEETVSNGRYCMERGGDKVYLMKNNRSIRFTMPVERYLDYIIIPPEESTSILSVLRDIRFSGTGLPSPISLMAVLPEREDARLMALSYGAVTHIITEPGVHEADPGTLQNLAQDLLGLISEGIVDYNCTQAELASYGFGEPWLQIDFDYQNGKGAPVLPYRLRVAPTEDGYIATANDEGIVYRILDLPFLHITYEDLVLRWFLSPFLADVSTLELRGDFGTRRFKLEGEHSKNLTVEQNGQTVDSELFRKFYNLVISAAASAPIDPQTRLPDGAADFTIRFCYRNSRKADDVIELFAAPRRSLMVRVNGACEFTMREAYLNTVTEALNALDAGQSFSTDW